MATTDDMADFPFSVLLAGPFTTEIGFNADQSLTILNVTGEAPSEQSYVNIQRPGSGGEALPLGRSTQKVTKGTTLVAAAEGSDVKIMLAWKEA